MTMWSKCIINVRQYNLGLKVEQKLATWLYMDTKIVSKSKKILRDFLSPVRLYERVITTGFYNKRQGCSKTIEVCPYF